jgi:hypothetical protein
MTKRTREQPALTAEEILRRMLNTPPKPHAEMAVRKAKKPRKKK